MNKKILIIGVAIIIAIVILILVCIKLRYHNTGSEISSLPVQYSTPQEEIEESPKEVQEKIEQISR